MGESGEGPVQPGGWPLRPFLLIGIVALTFPTGLLPMGTSFGEEWAAALNELAARDERIGQDVAFSRGPLGPILTPMDRGSALIWALPAHFLLSFAWWWGVRRLLGGVSRPLDALLFAAGAIASQWGGVASANVLIAAVLAWLAAGLRDRDPRPGLVAAVLVAVALLAKFEAGMAGAAALAAWMGIFLARDHRPIAVGWMALVAGVAAATLAAIWGAVGNDLSALPGFFRDGLAISSGWALQMARAGPAWMEWLPLPIALLYIGAIWGARRLRDPALPGLLLIGLPLCFFYRWYLPRADGRLLLAAGGQLAGLAAIPLAMAAGPSRLRWGLRLAVLMAAGLTAWGMAATYGGGVFLAGPRSMAAALDAGAIRDRVAAVSRARTESALLSPSAVHDLGEETVDAYGSADFLPILLHRLNWKPRPVLQSIMACSPELDRRCAGFFAGPEAPCFVLYPHERIDETYPPFLDCATWLELYRRYELRSTAGERLILSRRPAPRWFALREIGRSRVRLGEAAAIPKAAGRVVIGMPRLELTMAGEAKALVFKVVPPQARVAYEDGGELLAPISWLNAAGGVMASHLPRSLFEAVELFASEPDEAAGLSSAARSIALEADESSFAPEVEWTWLAPQQ